MTDESKTDRRRLFNELFVSKIKPRAGEPPQVTYRDRKQDGLLLRLNKNSKAWRVSFYDPTQAKMRTEHLGVWSPGAPDHMPLKDARDKAANFKANRKTTQYSRMSTNIKANLRRLGLLSVKPQADDDDVPTPLEYMKTRGKTRRARPDNDEEED